LREIGTYSNKGGGSGKGVERRGRGGKGRDGGVGGWVDDIEGSVAGCLSRRWKGRG